jgi:malonyl-CoA O-methyltransferase
MEVGCGTGILTQHLIHRYPHGRFIITDICPEMVSHCVRKYNDTPNMTFKVMDGDRPTSDRAFDIIASSMSLQWFDDPIESIKRQRRNLAPDGRVAYATLGQDNFPEWRETLDRMGEPVGLIQMPVLPGVVFQESIQVDYGSAEKFLATLRSTGAHQPRPGYRPLRPSALKNACTGFNRSYAGRITWRVVYGLLGREDPL